MKFNPEIYHRRSMRLRNYDYSQRPYCQIQNFFKIGKYLCRNFEI